VEAEDSTSKLWPCALLACWEEARKEIRIKEGKERKKNIKEIRHGAAMAVATTTAVVAK
jgi:hypothetical protein